MPSVDRKDIKRTVAQNGGGVPTAGNIRGINYVRTKRFDTSSRDKPLLYFCPALSDPSLCRNYPRGPRRSRLGALAAISRDLGTSPIVIFSSSLFRHLTAQVECRSRRALSSGFSLIFVYTRRAPLRTKRRGEDFPGKGPANEAHASLFTRSFAAIPSFREDNATYTSLCFVSLWKY